jgi:predicted dehydrogenase
MEMCCDVIVEKPMAIDEQQCRQIVDTQRQTGRKCQATFNMRYGPWVTQVKDLLMSGVIGEVLSVDFSEMLNTRHGASYFRRWHRNKANSGGLLLHKASHHFDVINWWLSALPVSVFAAGHRAFYTPQTALRYGLTKRGERCLGCPESGKCPFYLDIREPLHKALYLDQEQYDGYIWDGCVFSEAIDIEDAMDLVVTYDSGAKMSYSLNVFVPWEGLTVSFNGTKGRLEVKRMGQVDARGNIEGAVDARAADPADRALVQHSPGVVIFPHFRQPYAIDFWTGKGGHGGADPQIVEDLFSPDRPEDKYMRLADQRAGAYAILTGIAGNRSIETGKAVQIDDLCRDIGRPDFPPMPSPEEPLPTA